MPYIAVTPYETRNISSCCIAKKLGARKTVARIDSDEFQIRRTAKCLRSLGVDYLIYPENLASDEINIALRHNWARYWGELHDGGLLLIGVKIRTECPILTANLRTYLLQAIISMSRPSNGTMRQSSPTATMPYCATT